MGNIQDDSIHKSCVHAWQDDMMHTWYGKIWFHTKFNIHEETHLFKLSVVLYEEQSLLMEENFLIPFHGCLLIEEEGLWPLPEMLAYEAATLPPQRHQTLGLRYTNPRQTFHHSHTPGTLLALPRAIFFTPSSSRLGMLSAPDSFFLILSQFFFVFYPNIS